MEKFILFGIFSIPLIAVSWRTLFTIKSHGFYRFFGWEGILWIFIGNYKYWLIDPFGSNQVISWVLLINSGYLVLAATWAFKKYGRFDAGRDEKTLFRFEKTTEVIDRGIYQYIRHPLYASLIYLAWGICFKNPTHILLIVSVLSSLFFYVSSRFDEKECLAYFGDNYREYMTRSKMFVPMLF